MTGSELCEAIYLTCGFAAMKPLSPSAAGTILPVALMLFVNRSPTVFDHGDATLRTPVVRPLHSVSEVSR